VAYHGGLGRPLIAPPGAASRITPDDLAQFVQDHFTGSNMALAGEDYLHLDAATRLAPVVILPPRPSAAGLLGRCGGGAWTWISLPAALHVLRLQESACSNPTQCSAAQRPHN